MTGIGSLRDKFEFLSSLMLMGVCKIEALRAPSHLDLDLAGPGIEAHHTINFLRPPQLLLPNLPVVLRLGPVLLAHRVRSHLPPGSLVAIQKVR